MKALTLWPEWAVAFMRLGKRVENRTWAPPVGMVGQTLALHAGKAIGGGKIQAGVDALAAVAAVAGFDLARSHANGKPALWLRAQATGHSDVEPIPLGVIFATARLVDVRNLEQVPDDHPLLDDPWAFGPWCWVLDQYETLRTPIPCRGSQGLWEVPDEVLLGEVTHG